MLDPTSESQTSQSSRERLAIALRWFGMTLAFAPFVVSIAMIVASRLLDWVPGDLGIGWYGFAPVVIGGLGSLPFFLLVPWLTARVPWLDRSPLGVLALSALLSIPAGLAPLLAWNEFAVAPVCIMALGSVIAPRLLLTSLRPGALSATRGALPPALLEDRTR